VIPATNIHDDVAERTQAISAGRIGALHGMVKHLEIVSGVVPITRVKNEYRRCHRQLLSDYLVCNRFTVQHILPRGKLQPHRLTAGAKFVEGVVTYPGQPTWFDFDGK
jgi:uncharacterized protein (DUF488 family)